MPTGPLFLHLSGFSFRRHVQEWRARKSILMEELEYFDRVAGIWIYRLEMILPS
jgi:hypothetical protein